MRDPRRFVRTAWIAVHALWSMVALQILAVSVRPLAHMSGSFIAALIVEMLVGGLLGAAQQWVVRGSRRDMLRAFVATGAGTMVGLLAFGVAFSVGVWVFGEESMFTFALALVAGGACLAIAQSFVARPRFARFGIRLATTIAGVAAWLIILVLMTRGADTLGLTDEIGAWRSNWGVSTAIAAVAGAALGAITALSLPWPGRTKERSNSPRIGGDLGQELLADEV
jgi:hypothetical protein